MSRRLLIEPIGGKARSIDMAITHDPPSVHIYIWAPHQYLVWLRSEGRSHFLLVHAYHDGFRNTGTVGGLSDVDYVVQHRERPDIFLLLSRPGRGKYRLEIARMTEHMFQSLARIHFGQSVYEVRWRYGIGPLDPTAVIVNYGDIWEDLAHEQVEDMEKIEASIGTITGPTLRADPAFTEDRLLSDVLVGQELVRIRSGTSQPVFIMGSHQKEFGFDNSLPVLDAGLAYRDLIRLSRRLLSAALPPALAQYVLYRSLPGTY